MASPSLIASTKLINRIAKAMLLYVLMRQPAHLIMLV